MGVMSPKFIPLAYERLPPGVMVERGRSFYRQMSRRRSVRDLSAESPPRECIAHRQPWKFVIIDDPALRRAIRRAAEKEERENYEGRFPPEWLAALAPLGTGWRKPFLETAPYLVVVFKESYGREKDGGKVTNYYVNESVGIACGLFIAALQSMGLATLTHTPSPMGFLSRLLKRPPNEKPYILFPVGYPAEGATVPDLKRKTWEELTQVNDGSGVPSQPQTPTPDR
jgi:nitroreductase